MGDLGHARRRPRADLRRRRRRSIAGLGELDAEVRELAERGGVTLVTGFSTVAIRSVDGRLLSKTKQLMEAAGLALSIALLRPGNVRTRRYHGKFGLNSILGSRLESAKALGPLIDPNLHSCGSVPPHCDLI